MVSDATCNNPYSFQLVPQVNSVSPATGSTSGGTLISISGSGFPDSNFPLPSNTLSITLGGRPCSVVKSNFSTIQCYTPAQPLAPSPAPVTLANGTSLYPGMRGVAFEWYNTTAIASVADLFSKLGGPTILTPESTNNGYRALLPGGQWETPFDLQQARMGDPTSTIQIQILIFILISLSDVSWMVFYLSFLLQGTFIGLLLLWTAHQRPRLPDRLMELSQWDSDPIPISGQRLLLHWLGPPWSLCSKVLPPRLDPGAASAAGAEGLRPLWGGGICQGERLCETLLSSIISICLIYTYEMRTFFFI